MKLLSKLFEGMPGYWYQVFTVVSAFDDTPSLYSVVIYDQEYRRVKVLKDVSYLFGDAITEADCFVKSLEIID